MLVFGLVVGLVVHATSAPRFDLWMLLLTVGTFAGAYPLMYFAQEYIALWPAMLISAGFALTVIGVLAVVLLGVWLAARRRPPAGDCNSGGHPHRGHLARSPGHPAHHRGARLLHRHDATPGQDPCHRNRPPGEPAGVPGPARGTGMTRPVESYRPHPSAQERGSYRQAPGTSMGQPGRAGGGFSLTRTRDGLPKTPGLLSLGA